MKKLLLLILCLFVLSGCSTKIAYNFLGFVIKWYIGSYVSLDRSQKDFVNSKVEDFHRWHRHTELPRYADYIETLISRLQDGEISGQWVHGETDNVQLMLDTSVNYLKPTIIDLIASFSDQQVEEFMRNLEKKRKKYYRKYVDITQAKRRKKRQHELQDYIGPFFGRLSPQQELWVQEWLDNLQPYEGLTYEQQSLWAAKLQAAFALRSDRALLAAKLDELIFYRTDDWDPELQAILDHNQTISYQLIAQLVNSLSTKQRKKMFAKLRNYQRDFMELADKGVSVAHQPEAE